MNVGFSSLRQFIFRCQLAFTLSCGVFSAHGGVISQELGENEYGFVNGWISQSFTAEDARISTVSIRLHNNSDISSIVECDLFAGEGLTAQEIADPSAQIAHASTQVEPLFLGYVTFDMSAVTLVPGSKYTLAFHGLENGWSTLPSINDVGASGSGPGYPGGEAFYGLTPEPDLDLRFRIIPLNAKVSIINSDSVAMSVGEASDHATITLTRSGDMTQTATVHYATSTPQFAGAIPGTHYQPVNGTLSFGPGESVKNISVQILNDTIYQSNRVFIVELSPGEPNTLLNASAVSVTIFDDDADFVGFTSSSLVVSETDQQVTIPVQRSGKVNSPVSVNYYVFGSGATPGQDFVLDDGQLNFAAGETNKNISLQIKEDALVEGDEYFSIRLDAPAGAVFTNSTLFVTIQDRSSALQFAPSSVTLPENVGTFPLSIQRVGYPDGGVTVDYETVPQSAAANTDYVPVSGQITFAPGETNKTINLTILQDLIAEPNESFLVRLTSPTPQNFLTLPPPAVITISNQSAVVEFVTTNLNISETGRTAHLELRRSGLLGIPVSVLYLTLPGSATPGADYTARSGQVDFAAGATQAFIDIAILDDQLPESTENFWVNLTPASDNLTITNGTALVSILDDSAIVQFANSSGVVPENQGTAQITVQRTGNLEKSVSVDYSTQNGTALAGIHYVAATGTLEFGPGETSKAINIQIVNNNSNDGDLTFRVALLNVTGETLLGPDTVAAIQIADDDQSISFDRSEYTGYSDAGTVELTVIRSGKGTLAPISFSFTTADGTATAGTDYKTTSGQGQLGSGDTSVNISIPLLASDNVGRDFTVQLSAGPGTAVVSPGQARVILSSRGVFDFDYTFLPQGDDNISSFLAVQPSGKILFRGDIRLNTDGTTDRSFAQALPGQAKFMQQDGRIIYASPQFGPFTLARSTVDGSPDPTFPSTITGRFGPWKGPHDEIYVYDSSRNKVVRYSKDGVQDPSFQIAYNLSSEYDSIDASLDSEGAIYLRTGYPDYRTIRYNQDGTNQLLPISGRILNGSVIPAMDGKIYVSYYLLDDSAPEHLIRLNADLTIDTTWKDLHTGAIIQPLPDGRVVVGRASQFYSGHSSGIDILNPDGSIDPTFHHFIIGNPTAIALAGPSRIYVAGSPFRVDLEPFSKIVRIENDPPPVVQFSRPEYRFYNDVPVAAIKLTREGNVRVSVSVHLTSRDNSARAGSDFVGISQDVTFAPGEAEKDIALSFLNGGAQLPRDFSLHLDGTAVDPRRRVDTRVSIVPVPAGNFVSELNFSSNPLEIPMNRGYGFYPTLAIQPGRGYLVSASLDGYGDLLMRLKSNGDFDRDFFPSDFEATNIIQRIFLLGDRIVMSGNFARSPIVQTRDGGLDPDFAWPSLNIRDAIPASLTSAFVVAGYAPTLLSRVGAGGLIDPTFKTTPLLNSYDPISSIALQSDGKVLVATSHLTRFNPDGSLDSTFPDLNPDHYISNVKVLSDDRILVAGGFSSLGGQLFPGLARLNPNGTLDTTFNPDVESGFWVYTVAPFKDGTVVVGGSFPAKIKQLDSTGKAILDFTSFNPGASVRQLIVEDADNILFASESGVGRLTTRRVTQPHLSVMSVGLAGYPLKIDASPNHALELHWSANLLDWQPFFTTNAPSNTFNVTLPLDPAIPRRFYRLRQY